MDAVDVAIIGGGVVGCAVAAALSARGREVLLLEEASRLGSGVTSRNSGVVHSGLYYTPGSLKAESCVRGNRLLYEWAARTGVWHRKTGKLVVAQAPTQLEALERCHGNALASGAIGLTMITGEQARQLEPAVPALAALHCAETGIVDPHELVQSLEAAAQSRGAVFVTDARVTGITRAAPGFRLATTRGELGAERLVNAAGLHSDLIARMVGVDRYTIHPCRGNYFRLRSPVHYRHLIYPVKDKASPGLGVHLTLERGDGYRLGPDAEYVERRDDFADADHKRDAFLTAARRLLGPIDLEQLSYDGCGIRPKLRAAHEPEEKDFVLEEGPAGCVHLIGIESPGLTGALDLADRVTRLLV